MRRNTSFMRWVLSLLVLTGLFFGAAGQSLARGGEAVVLSTPTAHVVENDRSVEGALVVAAPGDIDLSLTMTIPSADEFPNIGETVTFTIKVKNNDSSLNATGITVKDIIPSGLTYKSDDGGGTYNKTTGIWVVGSLGAGITAQLKIIATVTQIGTIINEAEVWTADQGDPNSTPQDGFGDDYDSVTINPKIADLSITKTANDLTPNKGDIIHFTITVSNESNLDTAENVTVKDLLPAGLVYVSDTDGGNTYNSATGIWAVGTLLPMGSGPTPAPGSFDSITIYAEVTTIGAKTNVAEVWTSDQYDPDSTPGNGITSEDDYASVVATPKSADLSLTKTINNSSPNTGDPVIFTITVSNAGPDSATNVSVKDLLPSDFTYESHTIGENYDSVTGIWTVGGLVNGASAVININATTEVGSVATNWAEVWTSDQFDPDSIPGNNSTTTDDDDGTPIADLEIVQSANPLTVNVDSNVEFTITVSNKGLGKASNVSVKDVLPPGLTYISDTGAGAYNNGTGMWTVGSLLNGASATLKIIAKAESNGANTNWAEVWTSTQFDPDSTPGDGSTTADDDASVVVTAIAPSKTVVITEVGWMGTSSSTTNDEWIELYNTTGASVNLNGWHLRSYQYVYNSTTKDYDFVLNLDILLSGTIPSRTGVDDPNATIGYFLLERRAEAVNDSLYPVDGLVYGGSKYLSNSGELLLLCSAENIDLNTCSINKKGQVVDFVNGSLTGTTNPWPAGSTSNYGSMERKYYQSDEDIYWFTHTGAVPHYGKDANGNNIKGTPGHPNWAFNVTATPLATATRTPTATPKAAPGPVLVLNEFLARAGTDWNNDGVVDVYDEFIEVINAGTVNVTLSGYKLDDYELDANGNVISNGFTLPGTTLKPGEKAVFYGSQTGIRLEDSGDTVRLLRSSSVVDAVAYPPVKSLDVSVCRYVDAYGSWIFGCFPTPNRINTLMGGGAPASEGKPASFCYLPDSAPDEFVLAECKESGLGIWNRSYWDSFPGEGGQIWQSDEWDKWLVIYQ